MLTRTIVIFAVGLFVISGRALPATIVTVPVGSANNSGDPLRRGLGAVSYEYRIGAHEVTNGQYVEFLNAKDPTATNRLQLYSPLMTTDARGGVDISISNPIGQRYEVKAGRGSNPVVFVSWYDAVRFANWLHNGQGDGDTETGAYTLLGGTPEPQLGMEVVRNPQATWFLPNQDEWYKAGFFGPTQDRYFRYATQSDVPPASSPPSATPNSANMYDYSFALTGNAEFINEFNYLTDVGAYVNSASPFGTFDQAGNVIEWVENEAGIATRGIWGGSFRSPNDVSRGNRDEEFAVRESMAIGFRVATVPEPGTLASVFLTTIYAACLLRRRRR